MSLSVELTIELIGGIGTDGGMSILYALVVNIIHQHTLDG